MRILFICSRNRLRSPTAEAVFAANEIETASAGTAADAETPVSTDLLDWADLIVAMESRHRQLLMARHPRALRGKKLIVLGIEDRYQYMQRELIDELRLRMLPHLARRVEESTYREGTDAASIDSE